MDCSQLIQAFERTISQNQTELRQAQSFIQQLKDHSFSEFFYQCVKILSDQKNPGIARYQACLQAKNIISTKNEKTRDGIIEAWQNGFDQNKKEEIKQMILSALGTLRINGNYQRPSGTAQLIAAVAGLELPNNNWSTLLPWLSEQITSTPHNENNSTIKEASLETIGYICQDVANDYVEAYTSEVLTAIVHGMKEGINTETKLAAANAMYNSLEFIKPNFEKAQERDYIMQVVCECTQNGETKLQVMALQCLVEIVHLYYDYMESYMARALFGITNTAMQSSHNDVCLQGIEFWSNVCDEEYDLAILASEAWTKGGPPERVSKYYSKGAQKYIIPILCEILTRQEEYDDDWGPSGAAAVCIGLFAQVTEDEVLELVLPFISENISNENWRFRDAAVQALGSILDGPNPETLESLLEPGVATLVKLFDDPSVPVQDSVAFCVGKICEMVPRLVLNDQIFNTLLEKLLKGLDAPPRVASNVCWTIKSLVEAVFEYSEAEDDGEPLRTYQLSPHFNSMMSALLNTTNRDDGLEHNLRSAAYEAIMAMINCSADDCYDCVCKTTEEIMRRIDQFISLSNGKMSSTDRSDVVNIQSLLCATLSSVLKKIKPEHVVHMSDKVMEALLTMLQNSQNNKEKKDKNEDGDDIAYGGVHEDALLAVGTLAETAKDRFEMYMSAFLPFLTRALTNYEEADVNKAAVGVIGDISRALGSGFGKYVEQLMQILLQSLNSSELHQSVRPHILNLFGDVAMAIHQGFVRFLPFVFESLTQATSIQIDNSDYDAIDYLNELYENSLTTIIGIIHGLKTDSDQTSCIFELLPHLQFICGLIKKISIDNERTDDIVFNTCGVIGDLITSLVTDCKVKHAQADVTKVGLHQLLNDDSIKKMLQEGRLNKSRKIQQYSVWALREMKKMKNLIENNPGGAGQVGFMNNGQQQVN